MNEGDEVGEPLSPAFLAAWRRLAHEAIEPNPFFGPTLAQAALAHLARPDVRLAHVSDGAGKLIALAPVRACRLGRVVPAISVWTHLYGPLGTPLLDPFHLDAAAAELVKSMDPSDGRGILIFPYLPAGGAVAAALQRHAVAAGRPVRWIGTFDRAMLNRRAASDNVSIRGSVVRKKRRELARQMRRLAERGTLSQVRTMEPEFLKTEIEAFLVLEASGWKGRRATALALKPDAAAFARAAIAMSETGEAVIDAIRLDGHAIAMLVSFQSGDMATTWKIAHDERLARFSPGVQVMLSASDAFIADPAIRSVDSLATADHPMIDALWPERLTIGTLVLGPNKHALRFELGVALAKIEVRARRWIRAARNRNVWRSSRRERSHEQN